MTIYMLAKDNSPKSQPFPAGYPAVRIFSKRPIWTTKNDHLRLFTAWQNWLQSLNTVEGWQYLKTSTAGYFQNGFPYIQVEGFFLNPVNIIATKYGWGQVECLDYFSGPPIGKTPANIPYLIHRYTVERPDGSIVGSIPEQKSGIPVYVALISDVPMWVNMNNVTTYVPISSPPSPPPPTSVPYSVVSKTVTLSHGDVHINILQIDPKKVKFFVTPDNGRIRPSEALIKYGLHAAWNGDGFSFQTGLPIGAWASEGHVYQKSVMEDTLYIDKLNNFVIYPRSPVLWNAVSFPNRLITNGAINATLEHTSISPRTAMGWNGSQVFVVIVDGNESLGAGMTKPELANYMLNLGCQQAINFDGGGSSALAVDGELVSDKNDDGYERAVANVVGIY